MCGIAGILDWDANGHGSQEIRRVAGALAHRGPDGLHFEMVGPLALGHARLSILDPTAAGDQPMTSPDGRYTAVHNGEIYNFLELREELRNLGVEFRTETDTEVIIEAVRVWGLDAFDRFNGMWALAIWDSERRQLVLSRDRLGVKPMYLARQGRRVAFASEPTALLRLDWVPGDVDVAIVRDFLRLGLTDHTKHTFFEAIHALGAGTTVTIDSEGERVHRSWSPPELNSDASTRAASTDLETIRDLRSHVIGAVRLQLRSDVPIGSCLSGGLDSSTIVCAAHGLRTGALQSSYGSERSQNPQLAFFARFQEPQIDEARFVDAVAAATAIDVHSTSPTAEDFTESLPDIVRAQGEPFASTSIVAQYHVMKLAHNTGVKVLLDGQGADELFGGYPSGAAPRFAGALRRGELNAIGDFRRLGGAGLGQLLWHTATGGRARPNSLGRAAKGVLGPALGGDDTDPLPDVGKGTPLARALARETLFTSLPSLLRYEDRNSMAFGIEARVPFLDQDVVEAAFKLPDRLRIDATGRKVALRRAVDDFVPAAVRQRRDKIGFATPQTSWLRQAAGDWRGSLARPLAERDGLLASGIVQQSISEMAAGRAGAGGWRALATELWYRLVVLKSQ